MLKSLLLASLAAFLLPATGAAAPADGGAPPPLIGAVTRDCRNFIRVPGANGGSLMELDIFGRPAPSCRGGATRMRAAVSRLPTETWGRVGDWRCIWYVSEVYCGHAGVRVYATNPGG